MFCVLRIKYPYILAFGIAAISSELKVSNPEGQMRGFSYFFDSILNFMYSSVRIFLV